MLMMLGKIWQKHKEKYFFQLLKGIHLHRGMLILELVNIKLKTIFQENVKHFINKIENHVLKQRKFQVLLNIKFDFKVLKKKLFSILLDNRKDLKSLIIIQAK